MTYRALVQVWSEPDPTLNLRVDRQTGAPLVEEGDRLTRISPLGRFGIAEALRLGGVQVTAFALGDGHEAALRHALGSGAHRAIQLRPEEPGIDASMIAALADWLASQAPDLVIADRLAGQMAARLGWAHLAGLDHLAIERGTLTAVRHLGRGAREEVSARTPALVRLQTESPPRHYLAQARLAQVADRAIETVVMPALPPSASMLEIGPLQVSRPRTRLGAAPAAAPVKASDRLNALMGLGGRAPVKAVEKGPDPSIKTPEQMAEEFVRYLAHHNLLGER